MKIGRYFTPTRLWTLAFIISLLVLFIIGSISLRQIYALSTSQESVLRSYKIRIDLERVFSELKDAETAQRGYIITKDFDYLKPSNYAPVRINKSLLALKDLSKNDQKKRQQIERLTLLVNQRFRMLRDNVIVANRMSPSSQLFNELMRDEKNLMEQIRILIDTIITDEAAILDIQEKNHGTDLFLTPLTAILLIVFSVSIFLYTFLHITQNLRKVKKLNHSLSLMNETFKDAERIGEISHWQFNLEDETFLFSDNKYKLLGCELDFEPTLENFLSLVHADDRAIVRSSFNITSAVTSNTIYYRIIRSDKKIRNIKTISKNSFDDDGRQIAIGVDVDITSQYKNTVKLERKNLELKNSNDELTAFNHIVSHDLQEPLRKIQMFISRIDVSEFSQLSTNAQTYISRIQSSAQRAQQLIEDLLVYSRLSKNDQISQVTDLNGVLNAVLLELSHDISVKNATITADKLPSVNVIPDHMSLLFSNIISNSLKYQREKIDPIISINYTIIGSESLSPKVLPPNSQFHSFVFKDNGIGFDPTYADRIFELFHRLHENEKYSGTGIGLAICKKLAESQGGYIYASSSTSGAIFTLLLPIKIN